MAHLNDTFTEAVSGAPLSAHTADSGGTWFKAYPSTAATSPGIYPIGGGSIVASGHVGEHIWLYSDAAPAADIKLASTFYVANQTKVARVGVVARSDAAAATGYALLFDGAASTWCLCRLGAGSVVTDLASVAVSAYAIAATPAAELTISGTGASVVLDTKINGASIGLTYTDTSVDRVTAAGYTGLYFDTLDASAGMFLDSLASSDLTAGSAVAFSAPADGKIFQLSGGATGTAAISAAGSYGATAPNQARLVADGTQTAVSGFDWAAIGSASGGSFAHTFSGVPKGGWYNVQVRNSTEGTVYTSGKVGAGVLVALSGQSNAWLFFRAGDSTLTPSPRLRVFGAVNGNTWGAASASAMNGAIALGNALESALSCPVGLLDTAANGSGLTVMTGGGQWVPTTNTAYQDWASIVSGVGGKLAANVWIQGEADAGAGVSQAAYYAGLGTLFGAMSSAVGQSLPQILVLLARDTTGVADAQREAIKRAQAQKCSDAGVYRVERSDIALSGDGIHHAASGFTVLAARVARAVLAALGQVGEYRGPRISSVSQTSGTVYGVNLTYGVGSDITPLSGITGWRVLDGATPIAVSSATHAAGTNVIQLTLASAPAAMPTVQYLYGAAPVVSAIAVDNSALALPLEYHEGVVAGAGASGAVVSDVLTNRADSSALANVTPVYWAYFPGWRGDGDFPIAPVFGSGATDSSGRLAIGSGLPAGTSGYLRAVKKHVSDPTLDQVFEQWVTVV